MTWTKELPTKPGLYAWCDGRGGATHVACVSLYPRDGLHVTCNNEGRWMQFWNRDFPNGLWQPLTIDLPAPYVPPKPPKVYSAKCAGGDQRWLIVINNLVRVIDNNGDDTNGDACSWDEIRPHYTDIQRVPDEP